MTTAEEESAIHGLSRLQSSTYPSTKRSLLLSASSLSSHLDKSLFFFRCKQQAGDKQNEQSTGTLQVYLYLCIYLLNLLLSSKAKGPPLLAETTNRVGLCFCRSSAGREGRAGIARDRGGKRSRDGGRGRISPEVLATGREDAATTDREGVRRSKSPWVCFAEEHLCRSDDSWGGGVLQAERRAATASPAVCQPGKTVFSRYLLNFLERDWTG